jgi:hypothetical protein
MFLPSDEQMSSQRLYNLSFAMKDHDLSNRDQSAVQQKQLS